MKPLRLLLSAFLLVAAAQAHAADSKPAPWRPSGPKPAAPTAPASPARGVTIIDGVPDTGQFLPDTTWLIRVGPRTRTIRDFVEAWFASLVEFRPKGDSAGRVEFLNSMLNKEVLGLTALASQRPLGFEDRAKMREFNDRMLSNLLYQRLVMDSIQITEQDVREYWSQYTYSQRFRHITLFDGALAERVRADLVAGRIRWADAVKRYSRSKVDRGPDGELGWVTRDKLEPAIAEQIYVLKPGDISRVFEDREGFQIVQAVERKSAQAPAYEALRRTLRSQLYDFRASSRSGVIFDQLRREAAMVYDTANIRFATENFRETVKVRSEPLSTTFEINDIMPEFSPADTGRILARWKDGHLSLSRLVHHYMDITPLMRPNLTTFEAMRGQVDAVVLEPYIAGYARRLGLDKDPIAIAQSEHKLEEILVGHMFQDSIASRVWVSRPERREYYEKNKNQFFTFPRVRFAAFARNSRTSADSLAGALRAGANAEALVQADSATGSPTSSIQTRRDDEKGAYHKLLFEELRPGQVAVMGPDRSGDFAVIQLLQFDAGRQLSFEESEQYADESLQNIKGEKLLNEMLGRLKKRYPVASRPEIVMSIRLVDPTLQD